MGRKRVFDQEIALILYHELKTDTEIAETLGTSKSTIRGWRQRKRLENLNAKPKQKPIYYQAPQKPKSYRDILTPSQSIEMNHFLRVLSKIGRKAVEAGVKPDVGRLINAYIGRGEI